MTTRDRTSIPATSEPWLPAAAAEYEFHYACLSEHYGAAVQVPTEAMITAAAALAGRVAAAWPTPADGADAAARALEWKGDMYAWLELGRLGDTSLPPPSITAAHMFPPDLSLI